MKRLLLPLIASLALPTTVNALNFEDRVEICARYYSNQISIKQAASELGLKEAIIDKENYYLIFKTITLKMVVNNYCQFYRQSK